MGLDTSLLIIKWPVKVYASFILEECLFIIKILLPLQKLSPLILMFALQIYNIETRLF